MITPTKQKVILIVLAFLVPYACVYSGIENNTEWLGRLFANVLFDVFVLAVLVWLVARIRRLMEGGHLYDSLNLRAQVVLYRSFQLMLLLALLSWSYYEIVPVTLDVVELIEIRQPHSVVGKVAPRRASTNILNQEFEVVEAANKHRRYSLGFGTRRYLDGETKSLLVLPRSRIVLEVVDR